MWPRIQCQGWGAGSYIKEVETGRREAETPGCLIPRLGLRVVRAAAPHCHETFLVFKYDLILSNLSKV